MPIDVKKILLILLFTVVIVILGIESGMAQDLVFAQDDKLSALINSPLEQFRSGTPANDIVCSQGFTLLIKTEDNHPACVTPQTATKLVERNWGRIISQENKQALEKTPETNNTQVSQGINNASKFFQMPQDPYPIMIYHRPVFFMNPGSTAKVYVKYFSNWNYPDMVNLVEDLSVYNATTFQLLSNHPIAISVYPTSIPHKSGEIYDVVYSFTAKLGSKGIYGMRLAANCMNFGRGGIDIAVGLNSSQISPQDIPVGGVAEAMCAMRGFNEIHIIGFENAMVEYKPAISEP